MAACSLTLSFDFETEDKILAFFAKLGEAFLFTTNLGVAPPAAPVSQPKLPVARGGNAGVSAEVVAPKTEPFSVGPTVDKLLEENGAARTQGEQEMHDFIKSVDEEPKTTAVPVTEPKKPRAARGSKKTAPLAGPDDVPPPLEEPSPFEGAVTIEEFKRLGNEVCRVTKNPRLVADALAALPYHPRIFTEVHEEDRPRLAAAWRERLADAARTGKGKFDDVDEIPFK